MDSRDCGAGWGSTWRGMPAVGDFTFFGESLDPYSGSFATATLNCNWVYKVHDD
jgi:hypothetical protein